MFPYLISEGRRNILTCERHSDETVTLRKNVVEYEQMWKFMVEFLKFQCRGLKITKGNLVHGFICIQLVCTLFSL